MQNKTETELKKSRRPADTPFKQQNLKAWQPVLTAGRVYHFFFAIGVAAIPVGIGMLHVSNQVSEIVIDYTNCNRTVLSSNMSYFNTGTACSEYTSHNNSECFCNIPFTIEDDILGTVYMYYSLSNYYQNHRRYVRSQDEYQILGILSSSVATDCEPFARAFDDNAHLELPIAPCGAVANSKFNDTLMLYQISGSNERKSVPLLKTGIAWSFDKNVNFQNPYAPNGSLEQAFEGFTKPRNWQKYIWELDTEDQTNNGFQNEDLMVWMRTAGLPTFRKLYRLINHSDVQYANGLPKGNYELLVNYAYNVSDFNGSKTMILSTTSIIGAKNSFLGIAFIFAGCLWLILGSMFLFMHIKYGKRKTLDSSINPRATWSPYSEE